MKSMNPYKLSVASFVAFVALIHPTQAFLSQRGTFTFTCRHGEIISQHPNCVYIFPPKSSTSSSSSTTNLHMGLFDFLKSRGDDFVKLEDSTDAFGPGPLMILYNVPNGIHDDEIQDMIQDGAPIASTTKNGVMTRRIYPSDLSSTFQDDSVSNVLKKVLGDYTPTLVSNADMDPSGVPILYFSGFSNKEMMQTYNIIAGEIFQESQGAASAACAKVVAPALGKSFQQLIEEISGDHVGALKRGDSASER